MNYRQIEIFGMVMRMGTASRAAELLNITQPAVSRSLADLEAEIGFPLFDRVRNRLLPTPEAELFYRDVEDSFRGMDRLRTSAAWIRDRGAGEIRVASLSALSFSIVPRAIAAFRLAFPDIRVTLHVLWSRDVRDRVASGQFDLGLAADEINTTGVQCQRFITHRVMCAVPLGHPLEGRKMIRLSDLEGEPLIGYAPEDRLRQKLDVGFRDAGIVPHVVVETTYAATLCALVAAGVGIGFISALAARGLECSRMKLVPLDFAITSKCLLILPPDRQKSQHVRAFIDCLLAAR